MTADTVRLYAAYNAKVNMEMDEIISRLTDDEWNREFGGHYKSIHSLCAHIYKADFRWLTRFCQLRHFNFCKNPIFDEPFSWETSPFETIEEYLEKRRDLDRVLDEFALEVEDADLGKGLLYKNIAGSDQTRNFGTLVLHCFNHQTHHRGMISLYLDMLGKENDYSNMFHLG